MQNNIKHIIIFSIIFAVCTIAIALVGCTDDLIYESVEIPDTEVEICGEVIYKPLVSTEVQTRAEAPDGVKYSGIKSLYVFFFNSEGIKDEYSGDVNFTSVPSEGATHERVTFKKKVRSGRYYVFAVANISDTQKNALTEVASIEDLRKFKLDWDDDIEKDLEMFGVFKQDYTEGSVAPDNEDFETEELLTITPDRNSLHSWVRRAVSKVTVDFDGTNLKDNVTVYIKNAVLKHVSSGALLGISSKAVSNETEEAADGGNIICMSSNYSITYGEGNDHSGWPMVTKSRTFSPTDVWGSQSGVSFHDDNAKALPCYENMQGEPEDASKKYQDYNGDGIIDSKDYDGVVNGTYLEVEGYYVANRPEYKSEGKIVYRFMLGKDAEKNFDVVRNHHYKITMQFKGYGNDVDWHIVYNEKYLDITYPKDVNYQGKFFMPDHDYVNLHNGGHTFNDQNVITVTSYASNGTTNEWIEPDEINYTYYLYNDQTGEWNEDNGASSGWLTTKSGEVSKDRTQKQYTFVASMTEPTSTTVNSLFPNVPVGSQAEPHNLSNKNGGSNVENTANCYMVGAPGWYCFPLAYGNAITDGGTNADAYSSTHIVNHLNEPITAPYIKDNTRKDHPDKKIDLSNVSVKLIWQDAKQDGQYLITPSTISYDPSLFDGKGGIKFQIGKIQEGNAVIALIDNNAGEDESVYLNRGDVYGTGGSTKAIWSWHIWATRFGFGDFEKNIRITNHNEKVFDVMPVNLGWCSGGKEIKYYERRKCKITFKVGDKEIIREIVQYPHFLLPRGDHPYYQWGRKDPFVGSNGLWQNKQRWDHNGTLYDVWWQYNPPRLYQEPSKFSNNEGRKHTKDCIDVLIKNPDKWHNAPRWPDTENPYKSINESPSDLWSNNGKKTVYDPCPSGYQVGDNTVFTGFTTLGGKAMFPYDWYDVLENNMSDYYDKETVNSEVLELYTDPKKLQSIIFPVSGYRDYDSEAQVVKYPDKENGVKGEGYVWFNNVQDVTNSYHLKFHRSDVQSGKKWSDKDGRGTNTIMDPSAVYFNTDGFAVRPVSTKRPK